MVETLSVDLVRVSFVAFEDSLEDFCRTRKSRRWKQYQSFPCEHHHARDRTETSLLQ